MPLMGLIMSDVDLKRPPYGPDEVLYGSIKGPDKRPKKAS